MLGGPVGSSIGEGYFDGAIRGGFTPQESSLRTGLTPGGGGSMFPAASPNAQAIYSSLQSGGATPTTLDFHRTAMSAAAARKDPVQQGQTNGNNPQQRTAPVAAMSQAGQTQDFNQHDAANGLFLLAQAGNGAQANNQFAIPNPPTSIMNSQSQSHEMSPNLNRRGARNPNGSIGGGSLSGSARGQSELSAEDSGDQSKPTTRSKNKRTSAGKGAAAINGRRKAEDTPLKQPAAKKAKNNSAIAQPDVDGMGMESDEEQDMKEDQYHENGRKMTDEEKRKNFLERNRYRGSTTPSTSRLLMYFPGWRLSNADNERSNGSLICKLRLSCSAARTTP